MTAIAEIARVTRSGRTGAADTPEERSWLIWTAFREAVERTPFATPVGGGVHVTGAIKRYARDLFPTEVAWGDAEAERAFMAPIYKYLRQSGNAYVVRRNVGGDPYTSEWFLSSEWLERSARRTISLSRAELTRQARAEARTAAERRVSPREAGEDREPAPVVVTQALICRHPNCAGTPPFRTGKNLGGHFRGAHARFGPYELALARHGEYITTKVVPRPTGDSAEPYGCPFCEFASYHPAGIGPHAGKIHPGPWTVDQMYALWPINLRPKRPADLEAMDTTPAIEPVDEPKSTGTPWPAADVSAALATVQAALAAGAVAESRLAEIEGNPLVVVDGAAATLVADLRDALKTKPMLEFAAYAAERLSAT